MPQHYDVVVVGGGPAGASAARAAARAGARTVLLEKATLPRYKTCGGGLVEISADLAEVDLAPLARDRTTRLTFTHDGRRAATRSAPRPVFRMALRADLDAALVESAAAAGAEVRTGVTVVGVDDASDAGSVGTPGGASGVAVRLRGGEVVRAAAVVGADGSASRLGTYVGVACDQVDLGLEAEFPVEFGGPGPSRRAARWAGHVLLDWGPVPGSYGWLFPKGDLLTVGVIGDRAAGPALRTYFAALVERLGLSGVAPAVQSGHLTRVRRPGSPLVRGRVLLAGDAAGLLEPWTREGISYALRSGRLAGECAAGGPDRIAAYPRRVAEVLGPEIVAGRRLLAAFSARPAVFHAMLSGPAFGFFRRWVEGRTTFARQVGRPGADRLLAALG